MENKNNSGRTKLVLATLKGKETEDYNLQNLLASISYGELIPSPKPVPHKAMAAKRPVARKAPPVRRAAVKKKDSMAHFVVGGLAILALASCAPAVMGLGAGYNAAEDKDATVSMYRDSVEDREARIYVSKFDRYGDSANWRECRRKAERMTIKQNNQVEAGKDILFWCERGIPDYVQSAIKASVEPYIAIDPEAYIIEK